MQFDLTDSDVEMILTALRSVASEWERSAASSAGFAGDDIGGRLAREQVASWRALETKILAIYEGPRCNRLSLSRS